MWGLINMSLTLTLAQMDVATADPKTNMEKTILFAKEAKLRGSDIIVFPEMWTTGFDWKYNKEHAKEHHETEKQLLKIAKELKIGIHGTIPTLTSNGGIANSSVFISPEGNKLAQYDKIHLFSFAREDQHMEPGNAPRNLKTSWGQYGFAVCYDIRFPELFRGYAINGAQLIFLPSAFPHPRLEHWKTLIRARAIENQLYMVACNQVGTKQLEKEVTFFGHSCIIDPWGETVIEGGEAEQLLTATIDLSKSDEIRSYMRVFEDRRPHIYEL